MSAKQSNAQRRDTHAEITNKLIAAIETDPGNPTLPWRRSGGPLFMPTNALTNNVYSGINVVSLWVSAEINGYSAPVWATHRQWAELGAQVRKGEKSSLVVFYKEYESEPDPDNADDDGKRRFARAFHVFNASQVDGFTLPGAPEPLGPITRILAADRFMTATGVRIEHGGDRAFYCPATDHIQMSGEGLHHEIASEATGRLDGRVRQGHDGCQAQRRARAPAPKKGKCEGRKSHAEKRHEVVGETKRIHRASPLTGKRRSLRKIARGRPSLAAAVSTPSCAMAPIRATRHPGRRTVTRRRTTGGVVGIPLRRRADRSAGRLDCPQTFSAPVLLCPRRRGPRSPAR